MRLTELSSVVLMCSAVAPVLAQEPYDTRDEIEGSAVALAAFPIRPMVFRTATGVLWALNNNDNTLQRFQTTGAGASTSPTHTYPLPWGPVSIAYWEGPNGVADEVNGGDDELIVACRGTWSVVSVSAATGRVTDVVQLPASGGPGLTPDENRLGRMAEPGDVLVDSVNDRAFVSCTAADGVLQIDLLGARKLVTRIYHVSTHPNFRCKAPLFLSFDTDRKVLVTPLNAGNNSTWGGALASGASVIAATPALPDEDLFRIDATANTVTVVATGIGSTIFAHALNTVTQQVWVLNTNGLNRAPSPQSEPQLNGDFLSQGIARFDAPVQLVTPPATLPAPISLDPAASVLTPGPLSPSTVIGQPFALAFNKGAGGGQAFVAGVLTDNVLLLDSSGAFVHEFELPALADQRAIPRGVLVKSAASDKIGAFFVYAWGHNKVYEFTYDLNPGGATTILGYDLGRDPTPRLVRNGRAHFFDGTNSAHQNLSCASCHIDGGSDLLVWNLSHKEPLFSGGVTPIDDKGGMVTQTLVGLERLAPFHWRGERAELVDFNGAFEGLLGGSKLDVADPGQLPEEFNEFQAFLFSLVSPANPNQQRDRTLPRAVGFDDRGEFDLDGATEPPSNLITTANPKHGQVLFNGERSFKGGFMCADCHPQPTGTNNGIHVEVVGESQVRRSRLKPAAFHELWRKDQASRTYVGQTGSPSNLLHEFQSTLGVGITHTGEFVDLLDFVNAIFVDSAAFQNPTSSCLGAGGRTQCVADVVSFVDRWDSGLGQAAHFATRLASTQDATTRAAIGLELDFLHSQANPGATDPWGPAANCDIAVFGVSTAASGVRHWVYRRATDQFVCDDGLSVRTLQQFKTAAASGGEDHVFVGLPVGRGEGFGVDQDNDGHVTALDPSPVNPTQPGTSAAPALVAGSFDVPWITTRTARLRFETVEPTKAIVRYWPHNSTNLAKEVQHTQLSRVHAFMLNGLLSSTEIGDVGGVTAVPIGTLNTDVTIQYAGEIVLTNASGQASAPISFGPTSATATKPFLLPTFGLGASNAEFSPQTRVGDRQRQHEHFVSASEFDWITRDPATHLISGKLDFTVSFVRGGQLAAGGAAFEHEPAPDRVVIGRLFSKRVSETVLRSVHPITPGFGTAAADLARLELYGATPNCGVQLDLDGVNSGDNYEGRLLFSTILTNSAGATSIEFSFTDSNLAANDELWFVIDAVVEVDRERWFAMPHVVTDSPQCLEVQPPPDPPIPVPGTGTGLALLLLPARTFIYTNPQGVTVDNSQAAWTQWSFPETGEARALVKDELP